MFEDRTDAGERLADRLREEGVEADIVLAVPRGGLPLGRAVADALDAPLDIVAAKKLGAPENPELAIGAAASTGSVWVNDDLVERLGVDEAYIEAEREQAAETAKQKVDTYRDWPAPDLEGKRVVIVDDGVATGATIRACAMAAKDEGATYVTIAVPVGPPETLAALESLVDDVVCLQSPEHFGAVGRFYRDFSQVTDEEAMTYLDAEERG
ncbi:phosphoribosyltransferase [Halospeciosus flavus]|uniref:Phosphoribosyltransferase n=1 Tax=Halospeciosus flavus TaxID=3032283 RepID=A0ABD5Z1R5_9EURY|nr:phosphoribosyltransferase family protein [Halospeciosus flavus]